jgi:hypothetical protein
LKVYEVQIHGNLSCRVLDGIEPTTDMAKVGRTNPFLKTSRVCLIDCLTKYFNIEMIINSQNALFFIDVRQDYKLEIKPRLDYLLKLNVDAKLVSESGLTPITSLLNQIWYVEYYHNINSQIRLLMIHCQKGHQNAI